MAEQPAHPWRPLLKRRLAVAAAVFLLWSVAIEARLIYFQIYEHDALVKAAEQQQSRTVDAPARRGEILDRNGRVLAYSVDADTVYAVPSEIEDARRAAAALCKALSDCDAAEPGALAERLQSRRFFVYVRRQVSPEQARRVAALDLEGVGFIKENRRYYPNKELAAHLLGYVGVDNVGLDGIEATYDELIGGEPGKVLVQIDARRHAFSRVERPPTSGDTLELTVDLSLQHIAERELKAGVQWAGARGGSAVIMDPSTGEILAIANYPTFNPNADYGDVKEDARRNRAVQDLYEPGSTFKMITAAAALEEQVIAPDDAVDVSAGSIDFPGRPPIRDDHRHGILPFRDVIAKSSNVGAITVGLKVGGERFLDYMRRFGFGRRSSPDFPSENAGLLWTPRNDSALASMLIGYEIGVTPLQMAGALGSIANGGELVQPRVVRAVVRDGQRLPVPRKVLGRTISERTAAQLTTILEGVVEEGGTATRAQVAGYTVAGKTGTAKKIVNGSYRGHNDYNVSFAGFVPSRDPVFTIVVVVDSPRKVSPYGGVVAAPIFQKIADAALRHRGVRPSIDPAPPVLIARDDYGQRRQGLADGVREQPIAGPIVPPQIVTIAGTAGQAEPAFPDLAGMSARDAVQLLARMGIGARLQGVGFVVDQRPAAGSPLDSTAVASLWLERYPRRPEERRRAVPADRAATERP